ncbi:MAG TPA: 4-alpha-glucanotransferase [Baekduia sp.]|uniref:4-alpha-glucanotransferase n=1 Tax=Baekduia sp. TaxID=2600305 RepID=UPI002D772EEF|nr:4-alpha-glucanotransferase [Baekduia sp.]HET6506528.1 4-alpha-glucanotransferase [Baekduia sp.]
MTERTNLSATRSSGVQLHLTSLPGGRLGPEARRFVDWLAEAGQSWWQMLPLGPPDRYGSPYKASSAFAAWNGFLEAPAAEVAPEELDAFGERHAFWARSLPRRMWADQVRFEREWAALRTYARERGVGLIGDVPIYVAPGGYDQRAWPELFVDGVVAGVPPDAFTAAGQRWGNPLYDWPALRRRGYRWWVERFRRVSELYDIARIDHFRGFVAYWAVPAGDRDARGGTWRRGPGRAVFEAARRELGWNDYGGFIAEDLGVITPPVTRLRRSLGYPGMVVLQFAFDPDDPRGPHRLEHHRADVVAYTGTHDTDTLRGWLDALEPARRREAERAVRDAGIVDDDMDWALIRLWMSSVAPLVMLQVQDVLGLGSEARMNLPGTAGGAWKFRLEAGQLTASHARRLRAATEQAGRRAKR